MSNIPAAAVIGASIIAASFIARSPSPEYQYSQNLPKKRIHLASGCVEQITPTGWKTQGGCADAAEAPPTPTEAHIEHLRNNPDSAHRFDEVYGEGASQKYLK